MEKWYEVWIEGPHGKVKLADCMTFRKVFEVLEGFNEFCDRYEVWPDIFRFIIEIPEEEEEEERDHGEA